MELVEIEQHIYKWLEEHKNPYIAITRSWKDYAEEHNIPFEFSYGKLLEVSQILRTKVKIVDEEILNQRNK
jgi:hypothetical protein